jgi:hypothetical protein
MTVIAMNSLTTAIQGYLTPGITDEAKAVAFMAVREWILAGFEEDGCTGEEIDLMDLDNAAEEAIKNYADHH